MDREVEEQVEEAKKVVEDGGLVVFPTETAYGIAADVTDREAVEKVYEVKERSRSKGLTAIVADFEAAERYAELSEKEKKIVKEFMPGPLTLVAEKNENTPEILNRDFAFRISSSEVASRLAEVCPITATSANISGEETSYSVKDISEELLDEVDYVVDSGQLDPSSPTSTIAEIQDGEVVVHREGPIKKKEIVKVV